MVNATELRPGNLLLWNPKKAHPQTTILASPIEVVSVMASQVGYISPRIEHRAEPFEDDVLQLQPRFLSLEEVEPIPLTPEIVQNCSFTSAFGANKEWLNEECRISENEHGEFLLGKKDSSETTVAVNSLHHLQNIYYDLIGKELPVNSSWFNS